MYCWRKTFLCAPTLDLHILSGWMALHLGMPHYYLLSFWINWPILVFPSHWNAIHWLSQEWSYQTNICLLTNEDFSSFVIPCTFSCLLSLRFGPSVINIASSKASGMKWPPWDLTLVLPALQKLQRQGSALSARSLREGWQPTSPVWEFHGQKSLGGP